jgi:hypothetical protein
MYFKIKITINKASNFYFTMIENLLNKVHRPAQSPQEACTRRYRNAPVSPLQVTYPPIQLGGVNGLNAGKVQFITERIIL